MAENADGSPASSAPGIPFFDGMVKFGKLTGPDGKPVLVVSFEAEYHTNRYPMTWDDARRIGEAWMQALDAEHIDVVRNGNGKLWSPGGTH